jgi:hypothetical protein
MQLVNYYVSEKYTLRYTGGMVPDVNQVTDLHSQDKQRRRFVSS